LPRDPRGTRAHSARAPQRAGDGEVCVIDDEIVDGCVAVVAFFDWQNIPSAVHVVEVESCLDGVIPQHQRDRVGILPSLFIRKRSRIKGRRFAEDDAALNTDGGRLSVMKTSSMACHGRCSWSRYQLRSLVW
jgi:hypothetical protein